MHFQAALNRLQLFARGWLGDFHCFSSSVRLPFSSDHRQLSELEDYIYAAKRLLEIDGGCRRRDCSDL